MDTARREKIMTKYAEEVKPPSLPKILGTVALGAGLGEGLSFLGSKGIAKINTTPKTRAALELVKRLMVPIIGIGLSASILMRNKKIDAQLNRSPNV